MRSNSSSIEARINPSASGAAIDSRFVGLSYETEQVLPATVGSHYFRAEKLPLVRLFKTIGVKHLRIGGNSVDRPVTAIPNEADIDHLFSFARAAGVKVIYSVRLQEGDAASATRTVKHIHDRYADLVDCYSDGAWSGQWQPMALEHNQLIPITLPPASAAIMRVAVG